MILDRSFIDRNRHYELEDDSCRIILERLVDDGYFQNNRQLILSSWWSSLLRLFQVISSMTHLEKISLLHWKLTLAEDLLQMFRSCPKLTELHLELVESQMLQMNEELKNELRSGFQRIQLLELHWYIDSCLIIQEILT
jgi:hypothetical protein